jgi:hypothetical protein
MRKRALQGRRRVVPGYFDAAQRSAGGNTAGIDKPGQGEYALTFLAATGFLKIKQWGLI